MKTENEKDRLEREFLAGHYFMHYSGGKKILSHPKKFLNEEVFLMGEKEKDSFLQGGKLTHALMLENQTFKDKYIVSEIRLPSENVRLVIDEIVPQRTSDLLEDHREQVLAIMQRIGFHSAMVDMEKKFMKVAGDGGQAYWDHLIACTGKVLVDPVMYKECENAAHLINANAEATRLLIPKDGIYMNELYHEMLFDPESVGLAGTMDNVAIDLAANTVRVNDIKTSSKPLSHFPSVVETYSYWLQACFYKRLALDYARTLGMVDPAFEFHFIVSDVGDSVYCFPVSAETWVRWESQFEEFWKRFRFHYDSGNWDMPMEFATAGAFVL